MEYRMKQDYLKNNLYEDNAESEKYLVEDITQGAFHKWNDKWEIITRVCDWYGYHFRFYSDGRLVMQMLNANTSEDEFDWRGKDDCGHLEYQNIDEMLIDWLDELEQNEGSYKFDEEIAFIKTTFHRKGKINNMNFKDLKEKYVNKEFVIIGNTERTVLVTDIDDYYMTVKVIKNKYSRQNCVGNYFPYVNDVIKYPLTALPIMHAVAE